MFCFAFRMDRLVVPAVGEVESITFFRDMTGTLALPLPKFMTPPFGCFIALNPLAPSSAGVLGLATALVELRWTKGSSSDFWLGWVEKAEARLVAALEREVMELLRVLEYFSIELL